LTIAEESEEEREAVKAGRGEAVARVVRWNCEWIFPMCPLQNYYGPGGGLLAGNLDFAAGGEIDLTRDLWGNDAPASEKRIMSC
jgi:hypothetical protein